MSVEVTNLQAMPKEEGVDLSWEVSSIVYLIGFTLLVSKEGKIASRISLPVGTRSYNFRTNISGCKFNVRAVVEQGGKTVECDPTKVFVPMRVGLNAGGWRKESYKDITNVVKYVRLSSNYANIEEVNGAKAAGVNIASWVLGEGGSIGGIDPASYAKQAVSLLQNWGGEAIEVLNEPGGQWFWSDPTNYSAYVNILKATYEAVQKAFPLHPPKVLASFDGGRVEPLPGSINFGEQIYKLGAMNYCDAVTVHPYGGSSGQCGGAEGDRRKVFAAHAQSGKQIWITELGWPSGKERSLAATGDSQQWTEVQQAENITNFIKWARESKIVETVLFYGYVDGSETSAYGVERRDRSHKLAFASLGT